MTRGPVFHQQKLLIFFSPNAKLNIVLSKVWLQRSLIGVKSVEEGDRISHLEGYW